MRTPILALCAALATVAASGVMAAAGSATPPYRFYTVVDGLTQSDVYDVEQDQAGYLWFTTARGLNRFDGKDFEHYTIIDGLPTNSMTGLHVSADNALWVGDVQGGVSLIQGGKVIRSIPAASPDSGAILDIETHGSRLIAIADGIGVLQMDNAEIGTEWDIVGDESLGANNIAIAGDNVWVVGETGLYQLRTDAGHRLDKLNDDARKVHVDRSGITWVIDNANRIGTFTDGAFTVLSRIDTDDEVLGLASDSDGVIWATTETAFFAFNRFDNVIGHVGANIQRFDGVDQVKSIFVDREDTVWLASSSRLIRFLGDRFRHYPLRQGSEPVTAWAVTEDGQGRMWFGTHAGLTLRRDDESLLRIGEQFAVPAGAVRDVVTDARGNLWFSVTDSGIFRFDTETMTAESIPQSLGTDVFDIHIAPDGAVWFGTAESGVFRYLPELAEIEHFVVPGNTSVYTIDIWTDGTVWYGADGVGLVKLTPLANGGYESGIFGESTGLEKRVFNQILLTGPASAWIATEEGGLYRLSEGKFLNYGPTTPLADQTVYVIAALDNKTLVVGGEQGLYQFAPGKPGMTHYNQNVGFLGLETNVHAAFFDSSNGLWIGTVDGATRMDTTRPIPKTLNITPTIVRMESGLDRIKTEHDDEVDSGQLGVHVEYAAVSLVNPKDIVYSYQLVGADANWGTTTRNRSVSYPRIPSGDYEFRVRARFAGGEWSPEFASHKFRVLPFLWQEPWFIAVSIAVVVLLLRAAFVYRTRKIEWLNKTLRAQVHERTRSIEEAKHKLQQSNEKLSLEIDERQKADKARAEVEARFHRAFQNAPIGMGLLDADGMLFDSNPALKEMFWSDKDAPEKLSFAQLVGSTDRERFEHSYRQLTESEIDSVDEKLLCEGQDGAPVQTVVNLSPVLAEDGTFSYAVLQVQDITESMKLTVQLEYQASYDELTGLLNRRAFEGELTRAWERGSGGKGPSFLIFMDLDQFKVVNDTSGHGAGDQLLRGVSEILIDSVRANDIVARLGGDEFGIILWECPVEIASRIAESIRSRIEEYRFHWDTEIYKIGVSIGGLQIDSSVNGISELQQLADSACYAAKEAGRNRVHFVAGDKDSARAHRGQVRWVQRLREAMDNNRFAIYAQPMRPLDEQLVEPERLEILLRLRDPETRRLIPPGAFLPAAERYGLSSELDEWVIRRLLDTLFVHQAFQAEQRSYWINLSGTSIGDARFATFLKEAIANSPLPVGTINFEITETAVIRSVAEAGKLMHELRDMGCKFALDDFGTGLSSFGYLKKLPVDFLKIDGMFVRDILTDATDRIFVKSIIDIARSLNIKTIAEFVETEDMLDLLRELGADYAQGFAISRPFILAPRFPELNSPDSAPLKLHTGAG